MADKPTRAAGYASEQVALVRATCLYVATKLGDLMDAVVVVGGLVPSLLIRGEDLAEGEDPHVGTMDLDLGLAVAILDEGRYGAIAERLRRAGFSQDINDTGNATRQRWKLEGPHGLTVDFLIPPTRDTDRGGGLRNLEHDFAAIIAPGLQLAFQDRRKVRISGETVMGETASRDVWVCGPGAYVVLKALAFQSRGENKDAYDLYYVVRHFGSSVEDVAACLRPLVSDPAATEAVSVLQQDFLDQSGVGPRRVAEFLTGRSDESIQADVAGFVRRLLVAVREV